MSSEARAMDEKWWVAVGLENAEGATLYGIPLEEMTREELVAGVAILGKMLNQRDESRSLLFDSEVNA